MAETRRRYFLCVSNEGYAASLQVRTVYPGLSDPEAESHGMLRIVDESGEDYLFPDRLFISVEDSTEGTRAGSVWPERFFDEVVGGWQGEPLERPPQLDDEGPKET